MAGWYSNRWPATSTRRVGRAASRISAPDSGVSAMGFSTKMSLPARRARTAILGAIPPEWQEPRPPPRGPGALHRSFDTRAPGYCAAKAATRCGSFPLFDSASRASRIQAVHVRDHARGVNPENAPLRRGSGARKRGKRMGFRLNIWHPSDSPAPGGAKALHFACSENKLLHRLRRKK